MALAYSKKPTTTTTGIMPSPPQLLLTQDDLKKIAAYKAVEFVESGMVLGLGTGSTAKHAIDRIGELLQQGKLTNIIGIPTSKKTHEQALSLGIPLSDLETHPVLDLAIDGADEVDPHMNLVKGRGGSLLREKMIEGCCKKFIVIVDATKLVDYIGGSGLALPVEIVPFCWRFTAEKLRSLFKHAGCVAKLRVVGENGEPYVTVSPQIPGSIPRIDVGFRHEVEVDLNGMIKLVDLAHYEKTVHPATWKVISSIGNEIKNRNIRASFFNATPQGGGVALMRHALIRLCKLMEIDIHWFVAKPKPEVFDITKRKFHNVLQGVAPPDVCLTENDKRVFINWSNDNVERFWKDDEGPIKNSDVIIIDDPQVCGIIPQIKKLNPTCKIIYRSHIEICADLIRQNPTGPQAVTWNFLWSFISQADLFVSHPMHNFVPDNVPMEKVVLLPACTDPLDGLNKELSLSDLSYYKLVYNRLSIDQCGVEIDFHRPYIVQVARFDPSKGIDLLIHSFKLLHDKLKEAGWAQEKIPSLIICGAGSIDDPDGTPIYEKTHELLARPEYADIVNIVSVVRLPPCDQIFNTILRCAHVALQLSTREGFEIKVTEALAKGVPIIAFKAGGIPLQIKHGETGFLADIGDTEQVADYLFTLFNDQELYQRMSKKAVETLNEQYFTVFQTLNWLYLINRFAKERRKEMGKDIEIDEQVLCGNKKWVKELWAEQYNYKEVMNQQANDPEIEKKVIN